MADAHRRISSRCGRSLSLRRGTSSSSRCTSSSARYMTLCVPCSRDGLARRKANDAERCVDQEFGTREVSTGGDTIVRVARIDRPFAVRENLFGDRLSEGLWSPTETRPKNKHVTIQDAD